MSRQETSRTSAAGLLLAGVVLLVGMAPSPGAAQDVDARWLPWLGCWEALEGEDEAPLLCVRPSADGAGVEFVSWADGEATASDPILADGISRNVEREECQGIEEARFSDDGRRIYLKSEYVCEGGDRTKASGILAMINPMEWADIKAVDGSPWVLRYRLARSSKVEEAGLENVTGPRASAVKRARIAASARLTEEDIVEAVGKVDGAAVEALIVERGDPFAVDADMLVRLDDAGVPAGVIDLVVAVSFPERFAVKSGPVQVDEYATEEGYRPRRSIYMAGGFYDPFYWGMGSRWGYGFGYSPFYYGGYGYGGYGYGYGYPYGGYGYYRPTTIVVSPRTSSGRMIKGQGYTRGGGSSGYTGRTAGSRSGGSRGAASVGSSPGRSSGSSGRTAKPRGGGGGSTKISSSGASRGSSSSGARRAKPRGGGGLM
ncbi:MAG: hypothetical protein HKO65_01795 [Gemmatimonadetes bacterium]|nr:hypothetical protein [Gemmatimonadota bacterium]NNM03808.1 hypothetical protein [Gemmatimonadota bacterium]